CCAGAGPRLLSVCSVAAAAGAKAGPRHVPQGAKLPTEGLAPVLDRGLQVIPLLDVEPNPRIVREKKTPHRTRPLAMKPLGASRCWRTKASQNHPRRVTDLR